MRAAWLTAAPLRGETVERFVRLGAVLLVLAAGAALSLTRRMMPSAVILFGVGLMGIPARQTRRYRTFWEVLSFCYLLFFFADLFYLSASFASSLVHLFIFITLNKIFNLHNARDFYQLYLLTFLTVLAASSLSVEIEMFYMITIYIVLLIWNIVSLTLYQEWTKDRDSRFFPFSLLSPGYCLMILVASLAAFALALGFFYIMPRMQLGLFSGYNPGKVQHVSGFSEKVQLGEVTIGENRGIAMRVRVTGLGGQELPRLYWRGIAFDHYDGRSWTTLFPGNRFLYQDSSSTFYAYYYRGPTEQLVKQEIYMEPLDTRVIFGADRIIRIHGPFNQVTRDSNGSFFAMSRPENYEVYSRITIPSLDRLRKAGTTIPENIRRYYLQLPFKTDAIQQLADKVTSGKKTTIDRVIAIRDYLRRNYKYSTTGLPGNEKDPVSAFLFSRKAGHCEYFATSMALLLRYLGIPSRVVNGFLQGEYNDIGDFYVVRNSDAHSWVEVYLDGSWIAFDPSPRPEIVVQNSSSKLLDFTKILESVGFFWDRYILIFSAEDQINALMTIRDTFHDVSQRAGQTYKRMPDSLAGSLLSVWKTRRLTVLATCLFVLLALLAIRLASAMRKKEDLLRTPVLFYRQMLQLLERKGFSRVAHSTPAEFARDVGEQMESLDRESVEMVTDLFYRARYGSYQLTADDQAVIRESLARLARRAPRT